MTDQTIAREDSPVRDPEARVCRECGGTEFDPRNTTPVCDPCIKNAMAKYNRAERLK